MMENLEILLSLTGTTLGLLITVLTYIVKFSKSKKLRKKAEQIQEISGVLISFIKDAEKFTNYSGDEKKQFVLTKINSYALNHKIRIDESELSIKLEELVDLTKRVNNNQDKNSNWLEVLNG